MGCVVVAESSPPDRCRIIVHKADQPKELSAGTFIYAGIFLVECVGLALQRRWAEYFTIIDTSSFLPIEAYELARRVSIGKSAAFMINLAGGRVLNLRVEALSQANSEARSRMTRTQRRLIAVISPARNVRSWPDGCTICCSSLMCKSSSCRLISVTGSGVVP